MCSVCTTSYGEDRYGPIYAGRYGFQGNAPGQTPWLKNDPNCPGCRVGAFSAGEARPPMPNAQQTMPAGQAGDLSLYKALSVGSPWVLGIINVPPGTYVNWLTHNGWSCDRWAGQTRAQQLAFLHGAFVFNDYTWTLRGNDGYNQHFASVIRDAFGIVPQLTPNDVAVLSRLGGGTRPAGQASNNDKAISQLLTAINADCLRAAANPNIPHVSAASTSPVSVHRPSGQALNGGPVPSSMAKYAKGGRPFNAQPTLGTPMPLAFPLGFLPVGAGLDIPRGQLPMSAPAPILKQVTDWFGALLGGGKR